INHQFMIEIVGLLNHYTIKQNSALKEREADYEEKIKIFTEKLQVKTEAVAQHAARIKSQTTEINSLHKSRAAMEDQIRCMEGKIEASQVQTKTAEDRYRSLREHLNFAVEEQQNLYHLTKKHYEDAMEQARAMEQAQKATAEEAVQKADMIREQMLEKVRLVVAQNKMEAQELYTKINSLTLQIQDKDAELQQEKKATQTLSEELHNLQASSRGFEALSAQNQQMTEKLNAQLGRSVELQTKFEENTHEKLTSMTEKLENLVNLTTSQPDLLAGVRELHHEAADSVASKLKSFFESHGSNKESTDQLVEVVNTQMGKILEQLDNQQDALGQKLEKKLEENGTLSSLLKTKEAECQQREAEVDEMRKVSLRQMDKIRSLQEEIHEMETAIYDSTEKYHRLQDSETEVSCLTETLSAKESMIAELEKKLEAKDGTYRAEVQQFTASVLGFNKTIQTMDSTLKATADKAVSIARMEAKVEIEKAKTEAKEVLHRTQQQLDYMTSQTTSLKQALHEKEQKERDGIATTESLRESLSIAEERYKTMADDVKQQAAKAEQFRNQESAKLQKITTELDAAMERGLKSDGDFRRLCVKANAFFDVLKQWTTKEGLITEIDISFDTFFGDGEADETGPKLVQALGKLMDSLRSHALVGRGPSEPLRETNRDAEHHFQSEDILSQLSSLDGSNSAYYRDHQGDSRSTLNKDEGIDTPGNGDQSGITFPSNDFTVLQARNRRVVVRSPANDLGGPVPPSIDQEKKQRSLARQPKSILKRITGSMSQHGDAQESS
ncbi:hypothetical protein B0T24DRAFT_689688, partial [Lasiosphaeria ovina]